MSVRIRLARAGRKKVPFYHIVIADIKRSRDGKFIENIGYFNPLLEADDKHAVSINKERAEYWLSVGAQPTDRVASLMIKHDIKGAEKYKPVFIPKAKKAEEPKVEKTE